MTGSRISEGTLRVLEKVLPMPLASASDMASVLGRGATAVHAGLRELRGAGLVRPVALGCLQSRVQRFHLTESALEGMELTGTTWHQPGCLARLLERMTAVEWLYPAAAAINGLGRLTDFQWVDGVAFDAAVRYERGWVSMIWVGLLRSEASINDRFRELGQDLEALATGHPHPSPSQIYCVVPDRWAVELVLRVAHRYDLRDWVSVWCFADNSWHGARSFRPSRGWVYQPVYQREMTAGTWQDRACSSQWSWEGNRDVPALLARVRPAIVEAVGDRKEADRLLRRVRRSLRTGPSSKEPAGLLADFLASLPDAEEAPEEARILGRVVASARSPGISTDAAMLLLAVAEWPGIPTAMARTVLGEGPSGRRAQNWLLRLADRGLVRRWADGRDQRYRLTRDGMLLLARLDRVSPGDVWDRIRMDRWDTPGRFETHEHGLLKVAGQFIAAGCPVAAGWREWEVMGYSGEIDPDAMVYLERGPYGPGWHYLEYERSADNPGRVGRKLTGYDAPERVNDWAVLVVCGSDKIEGLFHQVGAVMKVPMLTTTTTRVAAHGPVGNWDCWRIVQPLDMSDHTFNGLSNVLG